MGEYPCFRYLYPRAHLHPCDITGHIRIGIWKCSRCKVMNAAPLLLVVPSLYYLLQSAAVYIPKYPRQFQDMTCPLVWDLSNYFSKCSPLPLNVVLCWRMPIDSGVTISGVYTWSRESFWFLAGHLSREAIREATLVSAIRKPRLSCGIRRLRHLS